MELPRRRFHDLSLMISAEYLDIPGLRLTAPQVARLWDVDAVTADALLSMLTEARFLSKTSDNAYVRKRDGLGGSSKGRAEVQPLVNTNAARQWPPTRLVRRAV